MEEKKETMLMDQVRHQLKVYNTNSICIIDNVFVESNNEEENTNGDTNGDTSGDTSSNGDTNGATGGLEETVSPLPIDTTTPQGM